MLFSLGEKKKENICLKERISVYFKTKGRLIDENLDLRVRIDELKKELYLEKVYRGKEYFQNDRGNLRFYGLKQTKYRTFYDCTWQFSVSDVLSGEDKTIDIRLVLSDYYTDKIKDVIEKLMKCNFIDEVRALDEREKIYYD